MGKFILVIVLLLGVELMEPGAEVGPDEARAFQEVSPVDLESLIYEDNIPGFRQVPAVRGKEGPEVKRNVAEHGGKSTSWISGRWESIDGLYGLRVGVTIHDSQMAAAESARQLIRSATLHVAIPHQGRIGDSSWMTIHGSGAVRVFVLGRTLVRVTMYSQRANVEPSQARQTVSPLAVSEDKIVDTLARGLEWTLRQRTDLLARSDSIERLSLEFAGKSVGPAVDLTSRKVAFAPISAFEYCGANVKWDAKANRASISYQGRTLDLKPFHQEASIDGRRIDLVETVLFTRDGPVVPVQKVGEALGIKVDVTRSTIRPN